MWILSFLFGLRLVCATQLNHTIDDASPLVTYRGGIDRNLTGFDPSQLNNGTITFIPPTAHDSPTISMNFTGTAIYVFVAYPSGHNESFTSGFSARIDGVPYGGWELPNTAPLTNHLAYRNTTMPNGPHNFVMQIQPEWELYFDYAVYTSGDADSSSTSSPASTELPSGNSADSSPTSSPASKELSSGNSADSSPTSSPASKESPSGNSVDSSPTSSPANKELPSGYAASSNPASKKISLGTIVGGVIGGLCLLALVLALLLLRRRARLKRAPTPFIEGFDPRSRNSQANKWAVSPPMAPFLLQTPAPARSNVRSEKSPPRLGIPSQPRTISMGISTEESPLSATSDLALLTMAEEMRQLRLQLETGMSEARDGGPILQRPPPYGMGQTI